MLKLLHSRLGFVIYDTYAVAYDVHLMKLSSSSVPWLVAAKDEPRSHGRHECLLLSLAGRPY